MNLNPFADSIKTFQTAPVRAALERYEALVNELREVNEFRPKLQIDLARAEKETNFRDEAALGKLALNRIKLEMIAPKVNQLENAMADAEKEFELIARGTMASALNDLTMLEIEAATEKAYAIFRQGAESDEEARKMAEASEKVRLARGKYSSWSYIEPYSERIKTGLEILAAAKS